jgi:hypothetical protein
MDELMNVTNNNIIIYCDNQGPIRLAHYPMLHKRTKHSEVRYHFIRKVVEDIL